MQFFLRTLQLGKFNPPIKIEKLHSSIKKFQTQACNEDISGQILYPSKSFLNHEVGTSLTELFSKTSFILDRSPIRIRSA